MRVGFHGGCRHVGFFTADEREPLDRDRTDVGGPQPKRARPRSDNFLIWAYQTHRNFRFPPFSWILVNGQVIGFWIEQKKLIIRLIFLLSDQFSRIFILILAQ
jgi:hypothetical protein